MTEEARDSLAKLLLARRLANQRRFGPWIAVRDRARQIAGRIRAKTPAPARIKLQKMPRLKWPALKAPAMKLPALRLPALRLPSPGKTPAKGSAPARPAAAKPLGLPRRAPKSRGGRTLPLGLDIGSSAVRWAQFSEQQGAAQLVQLGHEPLNLPDALPDALRPTELREQLRAIVTANRLSGPVALSLPADDVRLRVVKMPALPHEEMTQAIRWQVEQSLPPQITYNEIIADYLVVNGLSAPTEPRVLLVTVPRARVDALLECVRGAGLTPVAVEPDPFAVQAMLAWRAKIAAGQTALLLHFGAASASFSILVGRLVVFNRPMLTTGRALTQAVADQLRVGLAEAEALKRTHGLLRAPGMSAPAAAPDAPQAGAVSQALASPMENLMVDLLHAFKGFSHQVTQSQVQRFDRVFLDGGGSGLPGLAPWLQLRLGAPVEVLNPLENLTLPEPLASAKPWNTLTGHLSVALGLAARELAVQS